MNVYSPHNQPEQNQIQTPNLYPSVKKKSSKPHTHLPVQAAEMTQASDARWMKMAGVQFSAADTWVSLRPAKNYKYTL